MKTEISIIIPVYNVAPYIRQCMESIVSQLDGEEDDLFEVILVDDGSTDGSGKIADTCARQCTYMQVIHRKNEGVAAARNAGMRIAKGKWLYFMDSDDWLAEDGIALLRKAVGRHPESDMILLDGYRNTDMYEAVWEHFAHAFVLRQRRQLLKLQRGVLYYHMDFPGASVPLAAPWDKIYRRKFLLRHGIRFREELKVLDDMIFNMEVLGEAREVSYEKYKVYHYRHVTSSITNAYKADRVAQDQKVWDFITKYQEEKIAGGVWEEEEAEAFMQAFDCRIVRSFAICCRLNFYHKDNKRSHRKKQKFVQAVLEREPYRQAFGNVRIQNLEWKLRVVVLLVRGGLYRGLYLLHLGEALMNRVSLRRSAGWHR